MLVLSRKRGETIIFGDDIQVTVLEIRGDKVRLAITCPATVPVHREEVWVAIHGGSLPVPLPPPPPPPRSPEELAFLQSILESPDDESIRLIFADWLEDRDDPRGEFIRLQCRLAKLSAYHEESADLQQRECELLSEHGEQWRAYLPAVLRSSPLRRGFVESVEMTAREFLEHAGEIFASAPVRRLRVLPGRLPFVSAASALARSPHLARLAEIDMEDLDLSDADAALLAASPHVGGLTRLCLARNLIGSAGARLLASSSRFATDLRLDLRGNPLGEAGVQILRERFGSHVRL
jgi:carbon storage regulator CsrA